MNGIQTQGARIVSEILKSYTALTSLDLGSKKKGFEIMMMESFKDMDFFFFNGKAQTLELKE